MPNIKRSLLSLTIAAGLAVSGTGIATAQSSNLFAGSSNSAADKPDNNGDDFQGRHPANSVEGQYEATYAQALKKQGLQQDEELNTFAEDIADKVASGEINLERTENGFGYTLSWIVDREQEVAAEVTRLTHFEAQVYAPFMDGLLEDLLSDKDPSDDRLGYAVAKNDTHIFLVVSGEADIAPAGA